MRQVHWEYSCDWCGVEETRQTETAPEGWKLVLIGADNRGPNKWELRRHICGSCWDDRSTVLNPKEVTWANHADKD